MKEYDIFVPSTFNDGQPIPAEKLTALKLILVKQFGGLTYFPQENEGLWKIGRTTFRDRITILRVLTEDESEADLFLCNLKPELLKEFGQEEVLIVSRDVQRL